MARLSAHGRTCRRHGGSGMTDRWGGGSHDVWHIPLERACRHPFLVAGASDGILLHDLVVITATHAGRLHTALDRLSGEWDPYRAKATQWCSTALLCRYGTGDTFRSLAHGRPGIRKSCQSGHDGIPRHTGGLWIASLGAGGRLRASTGNGGTTGVYGAKPRCGELQDAGA